MRRRFRWDKKYLYWGVTAFCVIAASILFYLIISSFPIIAKGVSKIFSILSPFIWGIVITYLLSPVMHGLERLFREEKSPELSILPGKQKHPVFLPC